MFEVVVIWENGFSKIFKKVTAISISNGALFLDDDQIDIIDNIKTLISNIK